MTDMPPPAPGANNNPNKVRNILLGVIAAFVALGVIGSITGGSEDSKPADNTPKPVVTTAAAPPLVPQPTDEDLYIEQLYSDYGTAYWVNTMGEPFMINFGYTICQAINEGTTQEDFVLMAMSEGFTDFEALGYIAGTAVRFFCPENEWWIYNG
jgi:hypothetical protein